MLKGSLFESEVMSWACRCGADVTHRKTCAACGLPVTWTPTVKKKPPLESDIKAKIRAAVIAEGVLCWVHNVDNRLMHTGLGLGTADLICVVPPYGRFAAIEVKRPSRAAKPSPAQEKWLAVVRKFGGVSGVAKNVDEALALVREAREEWHGMNPPTRGLDHHSDRALRDTIQSANEHIVPIQIIRTP